jgi:putative FmdB family regulatory protein
MPTYEYVCTKCDHQFELFQSIADKPLSICPKDLCGMKTWGRGKVKKLIGAGAGLIFKGSGFYITDYRSEKYKEAAKKESGTAAPATGAKSGAGGEAKSASAKSPPAPAAGSSSTGKTGPNR